MAIRHHRWHHRWRPFLWPAGWLALGVVSLSCAPAHPWTLVIAMPALVLVGASFVFAVWAAFALAVPSAGTAAGRKCLACGGTGKSQSPPEELP